MKDRPKILFNAFACDPTQGSEPGLGWNWVSYAARHHRVHLLTADKEDRRTNLREAIEADSVLKENLTVEFIPWSLPDTPTARFLLRYYQPYFYRFYRHWMVASYNKAQEICQAGGVGLVHQNTYHSFREPGDFWRLPVPSVWAPVAGTGEMPWGFLPSFGAVEGLRHGMRNIVNLGHKRFNRRFREAIRGYSRVVAGSEGAARFMRKFRADVSMIPGQLIRTPPAEISRLRSADEPLQIVFCGQHFSRKGGGFLIEAFAAARSGAPLHLHMIGEGIMTPQWRRQAEKLGVASSITWHGRVNRDRVFEILHEADVFAFPSLADCYPAVIAEAFTAGLPVITTDIPGVGDMVDEKSGFRLRADTPSGLVRRMADVFVRLAKDPDEVDRLRAGVRQRAGEFLFEKRMQRLAAIYEELLSQSGRNWV